MSELYHQEHNIDTRSNNASTNSNPNSSQQNATHLVNQFLDATHNIAPPPVINGQTEAEMDHLRSVFASDRPVSQDLLFQLVQILQTSNLTAEDAMSHKRGVDQTYLDGLERIPTKKLSHDDSCAICTTPYLENQYPLVVRLPCNRKHHFDLECIGPWLKLNSTCPMCRVDLLAKKEPPPADDDDEEEDDLDYMYG